MKKYVKWALLLFVALTLTACAGSSGGGDTVRVKCPSCGYQFDAETHGQ